MKQIKILSREEYNHNRKGFKLYKNIEKQIHFILFFFTEGESLQGIEDTLKLLNDCNKPVLFVINRATGDTDEDEKSKDIKATISQIMG